MDVREQFSHQAKKIIELAKRLESDPLYDHYEGFLFTIKGIVNIGSSSLRYRLLNIITEIDPENNLDYIPKVIGTAFNIAVNNDDDLELQSLSYRSGTDKITIEFGNGNTPE